MRASDELPSDGYTLLAPRWIDETIRRIRAVDCIGRPVHDQVKRTALLLLAAAEADELAVPDVENFGRSGVAFVWVLGERLLEISVDRRAVRQVRIRDGKIVFDCRLRDYPLAIRWVRSAFDWLSPDYIRGEREERPR